MKLADFMARATQRKPKTPRDRTTYRAARRNIARIEYRWMRKQK